MEDSNNPIPRSRIFVLLDGVFAVRWSEDSVQELLTGQYRRFERRDFGAAITDFELNQLKTAGIVADYDRELVWLSPTLERSQYYRVNQQSRIRSFYLNTVQPGAALHGVQAALAKMALADELDARDRDDFVVIWGRQGRAFADFDEAEEARQLLIAQAPDLFGDTVVAFIETTRRES